MARKPQDDAGSGRGRRQPAEKPGQLPKRSWGGVLKRTMREFKEDNLTDWAAALTYYGVLAIFPALLALISILGLLGSASIKPLIDNFGSLAPGAARDIFTSMLTQLQSSQGKAGIALLIGIVIALWSASGYIAAFMRASNAVYDIGEGRPVWKTLPTRLVITLVVVVLLALGYRRPPYYRVFTRTCALTPAGYRPGPTRGWTPTSG
ncbi:YihY/virulence factor BrkB family protein [Streptomyces sp. 5K101]|uniref:YihY/virulence factor BrkB family protein n=1 Tax=Streptomyces sp. 5K101 TaxID=3390037 RepID=UPI0039751BE9